MSETPPPVSPPPDPPTQLATRPGVAPEGGYSPELLAAFQRGDIPGMLGILQLPADNPGAQVLARLARDTRRQDVGVLGSHEAFVRHTPSGSLLQVIRPVAVSIHDGTAWQIPKRRAFDPATGDVIGNLDAWKAQKKRYEWRDVPQTTAHLTYEGFLRQNAVAGCAVGQPAEVIVDGVPRTNPYLQRVQKADGRLGDVVRVVIAVIVVGLTPATGSPVVVNYTLDYDPAKDLLALLGTQAKAAPEEVYLVDEGDFERRPGWTFVPLYGGVGYAVNLRIPGVREAYDTFANILANALKKAQTVARRNAMRAHPALAVHTVEIDKRGRAVIPVVGWAGEDRAMARWAGLVAKLAQGGGADGFGDLVETVVVEATYEPDESPDAAGEASGAEGGVEGEVVDPDRIAAARLVTQIDDALAMLTPAQVASLKYRADGDLAHLRGVYDRITSILDK